MKSVKNWNINILNTKSMNELINILLLFIAVPLFFHLGGAYAYYMRNKYVSREYLLKIKWCVSSLAVGIAVSYIVELMNWQ